MLSPAERALVARDPAVAALPLLLDSDALADWLGAPVRRRYLRYKPGTGCVLGLDVDGQRAFVAAYSPAAEAKLDKTAVQAPTGTLLAVDRCRQVLAARPEADRDLPALRQLSAEPARQHLLGRLLPGRDTAGAHLTVLSHKPQRRWVGQITLRDGERAVLRLHRPTAAAVSTDTLRALEDGLPRTPRVLGSSAWLGAVAVTWLPGQAVHRLTGDAAALGGLWENAGAALAALHRRPQDGLPRHRPSHDIAAVNRAAVALSAVTPPLKTRAAALARALAPALGAPHPTAPAHGDFSPDQMVVGPDGQVGLVDLDAVTSAETAVDLAGLRAALLTAAVLGRSTVDPTFATGWFSAGYAAALPPPPPSRVAVHTAAALLRRAAEPFRLCTENWEEQTETLLAMAEVTYTASQS